MKFPFYKDVCDMFYIYKNFHQMILLDDTSPHWEYDIFQ